MKSIIEELWRGNICPSTESQVETVEKKELMGYVAEHHDKLQSTLTDEQKRILEKFDDCYAELTDISEREIFTYAFQLGARIAIEVMGFDAE